MNQSNAIAGFLLLAFIVFITIRGELPVYMGLLLSNPVSPSKAIIPADTNLANASNALDAAKTAMKLLPALA